MVFLDLSGKVFRGSFEVNSDYARGYRAHTQTLNTPEHMVHYDRRKANEPLVLGPNTFDFTIFRHLPSGLFVARGFDVFGDSGIVGTFDEENRKIAFRKIYGGKAPEGIDGVSVNRFGEVDYEGYSYLGPSGLSFVGTYSPLRTNPNFFGAWKLDEI
ncbi:MAG: hypothetical protein AABW73_01800 [Nanoarchaeota archaeon]